MKTLIAPIGLMAFCSIMILPVCSEAAAPCSTNPAGTSCAGTCAVATQGCVPVEILADSSGNFIRIECCDCAKPVCHVDYNPNLGTIFCSQPCTDPALTCTLLGKGNLDGTISYACECLDSGNPGQCQLTSECNPCLAGTCSLKCKGPCPNDPSEACVPKVIHQTSAGDFAVSECDCEVPEPGACRPVVQGGSVMCIEKCPTGIFCPDAVGTQNPQGGLDWTCPPCDPVEPTGACCRLGPPNVCIEPLTAQECQAQGGVYGGDGSVCTGDQPCCLPDGTCDDMDPICCEAKGGSVQPAASTCGGAIEACCYPGALGEILCDEVDPLCCENELGGTPLGSGTVCLGDNDGNFIDDACEPAECQPIPGTDQCTTVVCPIDTEKCRRRCVDVDLNSGTVTASLCECVGSDQCYVNVSAAAEPSCIGFCPPDEICVRTVTDIGAGIQRICCACEPEPAVCEPLDDLSDCKTFQCPVPGEDCIPRCLRFDPSATPAVTVVDCECRTPTDCHPEPSPFDPPLQPRCVGNCAADEVCVETVTTVGGVTEVCCDCEKMCDLPGPPADDPCATLQATDCISDDPNATCWPSSVEIGAAGINVLACDCFTEKCGPIQINIAIGEISCLGGCPEPNPQGPCVIFVNGVSQGVSTASVFSLPPGKATCDCVTLPPDGACCFDADGDGIKESCAEMTQAECDALFGTFHGAGTSCGQVGACCFDDDTPPDGVNERCEVMDETCCDDINGVFQGAGVPCLGDGNGNGIDDTCDEFCPLPPAPPVPLCVNMHKRDCLTDDPTLLETCLPSVVTIFIGGDFKPTECNCCEPDCCGDIKISGSILSCDGDCPVAGEVCQVHIDGSPTGNTSIDSLDYPQGGDMTCDCAPIDVGACCYDTDLDGIRETCAVMSLADCVLRSGTFHGAGTVCGQVGACCFNDGVNERCAEMDETCCADLTGSSFLGVGSACEGDNNGNGIDDACDPICEPTQDGQGCEPITCPVTPVVEICQPKCVNFDLLTGDVTVIDCDCLGTDECHVDLSTPPPAMPDCVGTCADGTACERTVVDNPQGGVDICCNCCPPEKLTINIGTGVDDDTGGLIPIGDPDDTWEVTCEPSPQGTLPRPALVITPNPMWLTIAGTRWISANTTGPNGDYCYEFCFCLDKRFRDPRLLIDLRADDAAEVFLNGVSIGSTPAPSFNTAAPTHVKATDPNLFVVGRNCVTVVVENIWGVVTGLNLAGSISASNGRCCDDRPGACCDADANCTIATEAECVGAFQGAGSLCLGIEACCHADGTCTEIDRACCLAKGSTPLGPSSVCSTEVGACCFGITGLSCDVMNRACCENLSGSTFHGNGTNCNDVNPANGIADVCEPPCLEPVVISNIASRYIEIRPDASVTDPVAFHIVCGTRNECDDRSKCDPADPNACQGIGDQSCDPVSNEGWVKLVRTNYPDDPAGTVLVNIGIASEPTCATADFLTPDQWTSGGLNALYVTGRPVCPSFAWGYVCDDGSLCDHKDAAACQGIGDESCDPIGPISRPTVTARCIDCAGPDAASVRPDLPTWVWCDSSKDGQTTFFADLFKQFSNTAAAGFPNFTGPDPGIEVDTQGNWPTVPDQQVTFFADIFQCFGATAAGGGDTWTGPTCP
ncbi:MAG: hypothetical protein V3W34_13785 [Phycisphaerae bacterium]